MSENNVPDDYVTLIQVLAEEEGFRAWFHSLESMPENRRISELGRIAAGLYSEGKRQEAKLIESMSNADIYQAIKRALFDFAR